MCVAPAIAALRRFFTQRMVRGLQLRGPTLKSSAGGCLCVLRQIVNEAQHQLAGFLVARQIVHGLPPDCLLGKRTRSREVTFRANLFRVNRFLRTTQTRQGFRNSSGNLAIFAATRRALSFH